MSIAETSQILQLILAPVVVLSACGILANGILSHYQAINDRLRALSRERLDLALGDPVSNRAADERLIEIDGQLPWLLVRHRRVRDALLLLYLAIAVFLACMITIGIASWSGAALASSIVLILFLGGIALLFLAMLWSAIEMRTSHQAVAYEVQRVASLPLSKPDDPHTTQT